MLFVQTRPSTQVNPISRGLRLNHVGITLQALARATAIPICICYSTIGSSTTTTVVAGGTTTTTITTKTTTANGTSTGLQFLISFPTYCTGSRIEEIIVKLYQNQNLFLLFKNIAPSTHTISKRVSVYISVRRFHYVMVAFNLFIA
jgi:hypothetical protein